MSDLMGDFDPNNPRNGWFILEMRTGAMDGYYADMEEARDMVKYWDSERPKYVHILARFGGCFHLKDGATRIPDEFWLADQK
jgi:hypothetical protein